MTMRRGRRLMALLAPLMMAAQPADEGAESTAQVIVVEQGDAEELATFQETASRYTTRMREFEEEARSIIRSREEQDKTQLWDGYSALLNDLGEDERRLRETAVSKFESFLSKYPDSPESASIKFRLAELHYEKSTEDWELADEEYNRIMDSLGDDIDYANLPEVPAKDFSRSIRLYQDIIREHPDYRYTDGAYYMLGYVYNDQTAAQHDEARALEFYEGLISNFPDSQFASVAHLDIGEHYFDYNQLEEAIPHYEKVVELEGIGGKHYDKGLYKLAWSHYKLSNYDQALSLLNDLLDFSEEKYQSSGRESSMAKEAVDYTAISFSDVADQTGERPVDVAARFYASVGERPFEPKVYKKLADVLIQQARYEDAIDTYAYLQDSWPLDPENPNFQWKIAELYSSLPVPDADATNRAVVELNNRYHDRSEWWQANQNNPDALATARGYIERSLATVASNAHVDAISSGDPLAFSAAAELYQQYLNEFPFADNYYEIQWYLADTLLESGRIEEAESQYQQLLKSGSDHNYTEMSIYRLALVRRQLVINAYGSPVELPEDAVVERTETLPSGAERNVYAIGELHQSYLQTNQRLMTADLYGKLSALEEEISAETDEKKRALLTEQSEEIARYAEGVERNRPALTYEVGQILYNHGQLDKAREVFFEIIDKYPERNEAAFSARLVIDSFNEQEDLSSVRKYAGIYATTILGPQGMVSAGDFKNIERQAAFLQAQETMELAKKLRREGDVDGAREKRLRAAESFLAYTAEFTEEDDIYKKAFYNIAQNYAEAGDLEQANRYFKQYVDRWPSDELSWPLTFRIAQNYAATLDLEGAVRYFEMLYRNAGKDYGDSSIALYNAAFLRIGMGQYREAARGFEEYARLFPNNADAEDAMFRAGALWEKVGEDEAIRFYRRYLQTYKSANPDHMMESYNRIAQLLEDSGARARQVDQAWRDLSSAYQSFSAQVGPAGRHYAAHAEFRKIEQDFAAFNEIAFTSNDTRNADLLINQKPEELASLVDRCTSLIATYQDFEYSSAALYVAGMTYLSYADMLYDAPPPSSLDEEELMLYQEAIDERRLPIEDKGKNRLQANIDKARQEKRWSPWLTKSLDALASRFPSEFAAEKAEIRGEGDSNYVPNAGPISVRVKTEETP